MKMHVFLLLMRTMCDFLVNGFGFGFQVTSKAMGMNTVPPTPRTGQSTRPMAPKEIG